MKKLLILFGLLITTLIGFSQTFNPANGTGSNKPYSPSQATPTDARQWFFDGINAKWRQYRSTAEVISFLNQSRYRSGNFPIFVHTGGTLNGDGTFTGGYTDEYWYKNNTTDTGLIAKNGNGRGIL